MTREKIRTMSDRPSMQKVPVELNFHQLEHLLKSHLASFDRAYYEESPLNASHFAEYVNLTGTLIKAIASHPHNKQQD